jgi:hypothetical protein
MSASTTTTDDDYEISAETSERVCAHMNHDHWVSVYAMAKSLLLASGKPQINHSSLSETKLTRIRSDGCHLRAVVCNGDTCEMHPLVYPFHPPLSSTKDLRARMVDIHQELCAPEISWLWTKLSCRIILLFVIPIMIMTFGVGMDKSMQILHHANFLRPPLTMIYGSIDMFRRVTQSSAWTIIVLHLSEAVYVFYHAVRSLKLRWTSALLWFVLIAMVGFPITMEFMDLLRAHQNSIADKNKKKD